MGLKLLVVAEARILEGVEAGVGEDSRLVDSDGRAHHTRRRAGRVEAKLLHFRAVLDSQISRDFATTIVEIFRKMFSKS